LGLKRFLNCKEQSQICACQENSSKLAFLEQTLFKRLLLFLQLKTWGKTGLLDKGTATAAGTGWGAASFEITLERLSLILEKRKDDEVAKNSDLKKRG
jgi:hypothetical protein